MMLAQKLYEGVNIGEEGLVGLITYMRTDSTRLSNDSITEARKFIKIIRERISAIRTETLFQKSTEHAGRA
jgi:DNA topoisomerase IA